MLRLADRRLGDRDHDPDIALRRRLRSAAASLHDRHLHAPVAPATPGWKAAGERLHEDHVLSRHGEGGSGRCRLPPDGIASFGADGALGEDHLPWRPPYLYQSDVERLGLTHVLLDAGSGDGDAERETTADTHTDGPGPGTASGSAQMLRARRFDELAREPPSPPVLDLRGTVCCRACNRSIRYDPASSTRGRCV